MEEVWCRNCGKFLGAIEETLVIPRKVRIKCPQCHTTESYSYTYLGAFVHAIAEYIR